MHDDDASGASGAPAETPAPFALRRVPPATAAERLTREDGMALALRFGATPYRDAGDQGRYVLFKEANLAPVEPWRRDPRNKRGYRRVQELRKAAGQLIGQPGDRIEIAKRLGMLHWEDGSDIEGAAARSLYDAIWSREHVYDSFTVPRRTGRSLMETGRVAAVAEEEARKLLAEDPKARGRLLGAHAQRPRPRLRGAEPRSGGLAVDKRKAEMSTLKNVGFNRGWFSRAESFRIKSPKP